MLEVLSFWSSCSQPLKVGGIRPHHNHRSQSPLSEDARALAPCGGGKDTVGTLESVDEGEARRLRLWGFGEEAKSLPHTLLINANGPHAHVHLPVLEPEVDMIRAESGRLDISLWTRDDKGKG